jgi:hypothetical protein
MQRYYLKLATAVKPNNNKKFIGLQRKRGPREFNGVDRIVNEWDIGEPSALSVGINECFAPLHTLPCNWDKWCVCTYVAPIRGAQTHRTDEASGGACISCPTFGISEWTRFGDCICFRPHVKCWRWHLHG